MPIGRDPNWGLTDPRTDWHNYNGKRWMHALFGEGHVVYWHFPPNYNADPKYDSNWYDINVVWW